MKQYFLIFFIIIVGSKLFSNDFTSSEVQEKRFNKIIEYIKSDSVIKKVLYKYYPEIDCFQFPDTTTYCDLLEDDYRFITNDTNKPIRYKWELDKKMDSINTIRRDNYKVEKVLYKNQNCIGKYNFEVFYINQSVWAVSILPKITMPGLWREVSYIFVFDDRNNIVKVKPSHVVQ